MMLNCPDYLAIWLGLTRVGVRVALLNTNLRTNASPIASGWRRRSS